MKEPMIESPRRVLRLMTLLCLIGFASLAGSGCGLFGPSDDINDDFSGTLQPKLADIYSFSVDANGGVIVKITSLSDSNMLLGIAIGQFVGNGCNPYTNLNNFAAKLNSQAINSAINKGSYCLMVYDNGTLTAAVNYTVRVTHP
jgi:hypothetical protein